MDSGLKDALLKSVHDNVNVPGLSKALLKNALKPALDRIVADTSNPFDNILLAAIYPTLESALVDEIEKQWEGLFSSKQDGDILGAPV